MKSNSTKQYIASAVLFLAFIAFTIIVKTVDVQAIGPLDSKVGLASINQYFRTALKRSEICWQISEILGYASLLIAGTFACIGLYQLIKGRSLKAVDIKIWILGFFYVVVIAFYVFFEKCIINYRPILSPNEELEASYPSSHTILGICIVYSTLIFLWAHFKKQPPLLKVVVVLLQLMVIAIVLCRFLSGVHWFTDILGGIILSSSLINLLNAYYSQHIN